jgi:hypothetical protein
VKLGLGGATFQRITAGLDALEVLELLGQLDAIAEGYKAAGAEENESAQRPDSPRG